MIKSTKTLVNQLFLFAVVMLLFLFSILCFQLLFIGLSSTLFLFNSLFGGLEGLTLYCYE